MREKTLVATIFLSVVPASLTVSDNFPLFFWEGVPNTSGIRDEMASEPYAPT